MSAVNIVENYPADIQKLWRSLAKINQEHFDCTNLLAEKLDSSSCLGFTILAKKNHCEVLYHKASDYCLEHFMEIREFLQLNAEQLGELLKSDNLAASSEEDVFNCLIEWIDYDRTVRKKYQAQLLKFVRLSLLRLSFLKERVLPICSPSPESMEIYANTLHELFKTKKSVKPRKSIQSLVGITFENKLNIYYHCSRRNKWMNWSNTLEYRYSPGLAVIENCIFLLGGHDDRPNNTVTCINLETMNLSYINPMIEHRRYCGAAALNGNLYAVGGRAKNGSSLKSVEKFDLENKAWSKVAPMEIGRRGFGTATINEKLYAVGGFSSNNEMLDSAECYDPQTDKWMPIKSMQERRCHFGIAVCNGQLYAVGSGSNNKTVERYSPETDSWTELCSLSDKEWYLQSCTTFHDEVIVFGKNCVEKYDVVANKWKTIASLTILHKCPRIFTYSYELFKSEFVENWSPPTKRFRHN